MLEKNEKHGLLFYMKELTLVIVLFVLLLLFYCFAPKFMTIENIKNILVQNAYIIVSSIGMAFVIIGGGIDLSVGYQYFSDRGNHYHINTMVSFTGMVFCINRIDDRNIIRCNKRVFVSKAAGTSDGYYIGNNGHISGNFLYHNKFKFHLWFAGLFQIYWTGKNIGNPC